MTQDIPPFVRTWLDEAFAEAPEPVHLYPQVAARVHQTPPQRGWLPQLPTGRFQSMFSATRFAAAGAIVALAAGFLLTNVLTTWQGDEPLPAAGASASASPQPEISEIPSPETPTALDLLSRVVTSKVAPGVLKIVSDGTSHEFSDGSIKSIAFGPDGAIWMSGDHGLFQLGEVGEVGGYPVSGEDLTVGPDGGLWATRGTSIATFADGKWTFTRTDTRVSALEVLPDGTVWARGETGLVRLDGGTVTAYPFAEAPFLRADASHSVGPSDFALTPDGSVWLALNRSGPGSPRIARFDGERWEVMQPLGEGEERHAGPLAVSPDGVLWAYLQGCADHDCPVTDATRERSYLARFDGTSWTVFGEADGVHDVGARHVWAGRIAVASDGTVLATEEDGLARRRLPSLDGPAQNTWPMTIDGISVHSLSAAPDGSIWAATEEGGFISVPEAAAVTE
jgi:hypothetical protein